MNLCLWKLYNFMILEDFDGEWIFLILFLLIKGNLIIFEVKFRFYLSRFEVDSSN